MEDKTGGQAFPNAAANSADLEWEEGMTLRDYFAGQALIGIMSTASAFDRADRRHDMVAKNAYMFADAMISARNAD